MYLKHIIDDDDGIGGKQFVAEIKWHNVMELVGLPFFVFVFVFHAVWKCVFMVLLKLLFFKRKLGHMLLSGFTRKFCDI